MTWRSEPTGGSVDAIHRGGRMTCPPPGHRVHHPTRIAPSASPVRPSPPLQCTRTQGRGTRAGRVVGCRVTPVKRGCNHKRGGSRGGAACAGCWVPGPAASFSPAAVAAAAAAAICSAAPAAEQGRTPLVPGLPQTRSRTRVVPRPRNHSSHPSSTPQMYTRAPCPGSRHRPPARDTRHRGPAWKMSTRAGVMPLASRIPAYPGAA
jgi:hypothetical protein